MSTAPTESGPFRPERSSHFSLLRDQLRAAGFNEAAVKGALQGKFERNLDMAYAVRRTSETSPFNSLLRLFVLGLPLSEESIRTALSLEGMNCLIDSGLILQVESGFRSVACLRPWRELFLLNDFLPSGGEPMPADFVMSGTSPSSISLTRITIRREVEIALDLGTGAGTHALLAASHARHVVATDTNKRALNFASMNARLNGIDNVSFVEGSLFDPVGDEKFDLIVSNPPFIISPPAQPMFQTAGLEGDSVSERMLRESPTHLCDGGCAITLMSWHHQNEKDWASRPSAWVEGTGCDFWLLRAASEDPLNYAAASLRHTQQVGSIAYGELLDQWVEFYRQQGYAKLALGAAILRKRAARRNWIHSEDLSGVAIESDAGEQIQRVFAAEDFLADVSGQELLETRVTVHPDHVLEQKLVAGDDGWMSQSLVLMPAHGFERRAAIDPRMMVFLSRCTGKRTVRELISHVSENDGVDFADAAAIGLPLVSGLLRAGFLTIS